MAGECWDPACTRRRKRVRRTRDLAELDLAGSSDRRHRLNLLVASTPWTWPIFELVLSNNRAHGVDLQVWTTMHNLPVMLLLKR